MPRKLPPLNALKAFESAARHSNFSKAASELNVTQGAISKQILLLETYIGTPLFQRRHRQVRLTPEGEAYMHDISAALDAMEQATDHLMQKRNHAQMLRINILPSLSSRWLIPLLDDFRKRLPDIGVDITTGDGPIDFSTANADIAIRVTKKNQWRQCHVETLMDEELLPVCAPSLLTSHHPLRRPDDLAHYQLLQHTSRPDMWPEYLAAIGHGDLPIRHQLGFEHFFMLIEAAADGMGIALIPRFLITSELEKKRLVVPYKKPYRSPYHYYFICPKHKIALRKVRLFRDWLMRQADG